MATPKANSGSVAAIRSRMRQAAKRSGIPARLIVVGMLSNGFTIADPSDAGMMDCVGFDVATPGVMAQFSRGEL